MAEPREFYIPAGAVKVAMKNGAAVFYLYEQAGKPCARAFIGKAQKPSWRFAFPSVAAREKHIAGSMEGIAASEAYKAKRKAEAARPHGWEVGLILCSSWGYDQTNIDFYEIVEVVGKSMVRIEEIGSQRATDAGEGYSSMSDHVVPDPDKRSGNFMRCKVNRGNVKVSSCSHASPWDGKPKYCSWYA